MKHFRIMTLWNVGIFALHCIRQQEVHHGAGHNSATHSSPETWVNWQRRQKDRKQTGEAATTKETKITERLNLKANNIKYPVHSLF